MKPLKNIGKRTQRKLIQLMNKATIKIDCDNNRIEIRSESIDISKLEYPIRDNRAEIIAQIAVSYINKLMNLNEKDLKATMINYLKK